MSQDFEELPMSIVEVRTTAPVRDNIAFGAGVVGGITKGATALFGKSPLERAIGRVCPKEKDQGRLWALVYGAGALGAGVVGVTLIALVSPLVVAAANLVERLGPSKEERRAAIKAKAAKQGLKAQKKKDYEDAIKRRAADDALINHRDKKKKKKNSWL